MKPDSQVVTRHLIQAIISYIPQLGWTGSVKIGRIEPRCRISGAVSYYAMREGERGWRARCVKKKRKKSNREINETNSVFVKQKV